MGVLIWIFILGFSLFMLLKAAQMFTESAESVGRWLKIPNFILGVTIVALGTSLPELGSSILAVTNGSSEIVAGNVFGSNIANILMIVGITALASRGLKSSWHLVHGDLLFLGISTLFVFVTTYDGRFTTLEGIVGLFMVVMYLLYLTWTFKRRNIEELLSRDTLTIEIGFTLVVSVVFVFLGAQGTVRSLIELSQHFNVGTAILGASALAIGTSLPELAVNIQAALRNQDDIVIGNIIGSNIFNSLLIFGAAGLFGELVITNAILQYTLPASMIATIIMFLFLKDRIVTRAEGMMLSALYLLYLAKLFELF